MAHVEIRKIISRVKVPNKDNAADIYLYIEDEIIPITKDQALDFIRICNLEKQGRRVYEDTVEITFQ